ncbi:MAG: serine/threonine protein kinase [Deltaproteobacteria bacterium]|nr:MAG: serine/threonine protein kinase [Deltaproteobacteria bacterium]
MIGRGAMADVFEAEDTRDGGLVALKLLRAAVARDAVARERFRVEAEVQRRIVHRNVARIFDAGVYHTKPYLAMELLRGRSLLTVLRQERTVPPFRAASYAWQALQGLAATHAAGVLHRDLKPANLMLEPSEGPIERVVLIDFGFASIGVATGLTGIGSVVGTLSYLAPERLRGQSPDGRADVYGVGVILYELLVGRPPFDGGDAEIMRGHLQVEPVPPSRVAPDADIPPALERVVLRALAKFPESRFGSAAEMADAIEAAL